MIFYGDLLFPFRLILMAWLIDGSHLYSFFLAGSFMATALIMATLIFELLSVSGGSMEMPVATTGGMGCGLQ